MTQSAQFEKVQPQMNKQFASEIYDAKYSVSVRSTTNDQTKSHIVIQSYLKILANKDSRTKSIYLCLFIFFVRFLNILCQSFLTIFFFSASQDIGPEELLPLAEALKENRTITTLYLSLLFSLFHFILFDRFV